MPDIPIVMTMGGGGPVLREGDVKSIISVHLASVLDSCLSSLLGTLWLLRLLSLDIGEHLPQHWTPTNHLAHPIEPLRRRQHLLLPPHLQFPLVYTALLAADLVRLLVLPPALLAAVVLGLSQTPSCAPPPAGRRGNRSRTLPVMVVSTAIVFLALLRSAAVDTILVRNNITKEIMVEDMKEIEKNQMMMVKETLTW